MTNDTLELNAANIVDYVGRILERRGGDSYLGEDVTMLEHMLQAATLAEAEGADDELVAAALLHDIGHYTGEFSEELALEVDNHHDDGGAAVLAPFFPARLVGCVRNHVAAKRYLCAVDPEYLARLSPASVRTLELQGGPISPQEVAAFESLPDFADSVRVRQWDDAAKVAGRTTPGFRHFAPMLRRLAEIGPQGGAR
ncbi:MAG: HD domain-containing protein [Rhodospirillaceae bacterium]